jgi:hypothetical protein
MKSFLKLGEHLLDFVAIDLLQRSQRIGIQIFLCPILGGRYHLIETQRVICAKTDRRQQHGTQRTDSYPSRSHGLFGSGKTPSISPFRVFRGSVNLASVATKT